MALVTPAVSAVVVTRGDQVLHELIGSLPKEWEVLVWDNGGGRLDCFAPVRGHSRPRWWFEVDDQSVYGRYAAIEHAHGDLIYVQDDDCIVSDPQVIVDTWLRGANRSAEASPQAQVGAAATWPKHLHPRGSDVLVANMPAEFRHEFYADHALVGFGACFHRDAPTRAFRRWDSSGAPIGVTGLDKEMEFFRRTCDIVFTGLTPRVLVDVPKRDLPWAHYEDRMWKQPGQQAERVRMLDLVRRLR